MSFLAEIRRRKVVQVAAVYAVVAWLLIQIVVSVETPLSLPGWADTLVIVLLIVGFPAALILSWIFDLTPSGIEATDGAATRSAPPSPPTHWIMHASQVLVLLAVGFLVFDRYLLDESPVERNTDQSLQRLSIVLPEDAAITFGWFPGRSLAISPDGRTVAYVASRVGDLASNRHLALRNLDSLTIRSLPGTTGAAQPFFSPDGEWVAFFTPEGAIKKVAIDGGSTLTLAEDPRITGVFNFGVWLEDDRIQFTIQEPNMLVSSWQVPADGGDPAPAAIGLAVATDLIPGTGTLLLNAFGPEGPMIDAMHVATAERQRILGNATFPQYLGDRLLFFRGESVLVAPFDPDTLMLTGPAVPLPEEIRRDGLAGEGPIPQIVAARNGTLAYPPAVETDNTLFLVARDGRAERLDQPADLYRYVDVSPDGRYAALTVGRTESSEVRLLDLTRGTIRTLTQDGSDSGPAWHPDGESLALTVAGGDGRGLFVRDLDGVQSLLESVSGAAVAAAIHSPSWHPDGETLSFTRQRALDSDIFMLSVGDDAGSRPVIEGPTRTHSPQISPDGRWLAYVSGAAGLGGSQVYLRRFPDGSDTVVSRGFAVGPRWSADGSELFFQGHDNGELTMMSVTVTGEDENPLGPIRALFPMRVLTASGAPETYALSLGLGITYDVLPDGRFLIPRGADVVQQREIVVVQNLGL